MCDLCQVPAKKTEAEETRQEGYEEREKAGEKNECIKENRQVEQDSLYRFNKEQRGS